MTGIRFYRGRSGKLRGFSAVGHTGSAPQGEDLVCAGVSALTQTAANALEAVAGVVPITHVGEGFLSVRLPRGLSAGQLYRAQIILRTVRRGLMDMEAAYPQHVRVR